MAQRRAVTNRLAARYRAGSRSEKSEILDQLVELTGWHRDHARAALRQAGTVRVVVPRKARPPVYSAELINALELCWRVARNPSGKRLSPMLTWLVPMLRREGLLVLTDTQAALLVAMSSATIDRRLGPTKTAEGFSGRSHTKPGSLLKSQIPIRTWSEWNDTTPGFVEIDLVGHEGGNPHGEFCFTLTMVDIATGWTVNRSVLNKAAIGVLDAIKYATARFPFPILGIDSDNGSEFINAHLFDYCQANKITFTRARPGNKDDGCHVEQKNWTHVRSLVGYMRHDTPEELTVLNEIWELDTPFTNLLLPQQKLISRERVGAKVIKRHDKAQTPHQRALNAGVMTPARKGQLTRQLRGLQPGRASREIDLLVDRLERLSLTTTRTTPRTINRAFNHRDRPELLGEATGGRVEGSPGLITAGSTHTKPRSPRIQMHGGTVGCLYRRSPSGEQLRVLQVIPQMESSAGAETSLHAVDPLLIQAGFDIHLAVLTEHQNLVPDLVLTGVEFHDLSGSSGAAQLSALARLIRRLRPDLVHASLLQAALPNQLIRPLMRVPVLVTWASTPTTPEGDVAPWKHALVRAADTAAAAFSRSRFHAVTQGVADSNRVALHVGSKRVRVAERGRDQDRYRPPGSAERQKARANLGITDPSDFMLLAVGRQEPQKDYPLLIRAFDSAAAVRSSLRLFIAGRAGSATREIESALKDARHGDRIELLGQRDDVAALLCAADGVVCSSRREGAAGSLIEAMATGTPIVSVQLDGLVGVLDHEVNALVVAREHLASGVVRLADDESLRRRLADAARTMFLERFTVERSAEALAEVYRWAASR